MSRLHKKCVLGATTMHALLLLALLVGPAFFTKKEEPLDIQEITFVPSILTDAMMSNPGGAAPGGQTQTPPQPQPQQPIAPPQPPTPEPPKREEVVEPEPVKPPKPQPKTVEPDEPKINDRASDKTPKPVQQKKHEVKVSDTRVNLRNRNTTTTSRQATGSSNSQTSNNSALASALRSTRNNIGSGLSSGTDIRMPAGQGGGSGASYANYAQEIQRRYKAAYDRQLQAAGDIADGSAQVETSIVILRNGTISSSSIVKPSGNAELDSLTRRVLDSIREVPPFPAGATDSRRTFNIIFDLKPKINVG